MTLEKAIQSSSVVVVPLEKGPIKRQFSIALLGGPIAAGPIRDLLTLLRSLAPQPGRMKGKRGLRGKRP
jgi:hypothetical protein